MLLETESILIPIQVVEQEIDKTLVVVKTELPQRSDTGFFLQNIHGHPMVFLLKTTFYRNGFHPIRGIYATNCNNLIYNIIYMIFNILF